MKGVSLNALYNASSQEVNQKQTTGTGTAKKGSGMEAIAHRKVQILFLAANPEGTDKIAFDEEIRTVKEKIRASRYRDQLNLVFAWAVRFDDLLQELNEREAQIVHFSGHGSPTGEIILVGDDGVARPIDPSTFRDLIETTSDSIRVVVLNTCYSEPMAAAVEEIIDCAIGTKGQLGDKAAIAFAGSFYRAIGFGCSVWNAFRQGLISVRHCNVYGYDVPQLLHRKNVDPNCIFLVGVKDDIHEDKQGSQMNQKSRTDEHIDLGKEKPRTSLAKVDLSEVDFAGKDLSGVDLTEANLVAANLSGAILRGGNFTRAKMWAVDLTDADLTGAVLVGADLTHANLTGANLTDADLTDAILVRTIIDESIEIAGQVRAGQGDVMIDLPELEDGQLYRFKVVGDSMEREGIFDGDYVILKASLNYWPNSQEMIVTKYLPIDVEPGPWIGPGYIDPTIEIDESELKVALKIFYESVQDGFYRLGWKKYNEPLKTDAGNPKMILTRYIKPIGRVMAIQKMGRKWDFCEPIGEPKIIGG